MDQKEIDRQVEYYLKMKPGSMMESLGKATKLLELAKLGPSQELLDEIFLFYLPGQGGGYAYAKVIAELGVSEEALKKGIGVFMESRKNIKSHRWLKQDAKREAIELAKILLKKEEMTDEEFDEWWREQK